MTAVPLHGSRGPMGIVPSVLWLRMLDLLLRGWRKKVNLMGGASKDFFFPHLFLSAVLSVVFVLLQCIAVVVFQGRCDDVNITPPSFLRRPWMAAPPPSPPPFVGGAQQCILRRSGGPEREWKLRGKRGREGGRDGEGSEGEGSGHHLSRAKRYMDDEERRGSHARQRASGGRVVVQTTTWNSRRAS